MVQKTNQDGEVTELHLELVAAFLPRHWDVPGFILIPPSENAPSPTTRQRCPGRAPAGPRQVPSPHPEGDGSGRGRAAELTFAKGTRLNKGGPPNTAGLPQEPERPVWGRSGAARGAAPQRLRSRRAEGQRGPAPSPCPLPQGSGARSAARGEPPGAPRARRGLRLRRHLPGPARGSGAEAGAGRGARPGPTCGGGRGLRGAGAGAGPGRWERPQRSLAAAPSSGQAGQPSAEPRPGSGAEERRPGPSSRRRSGGGSPRLPSAERLPAPPLPPSRPCSRPGSQARPVERRAERGWSAPSPPGSHPALHHPQGCGGVHAAPPVQGFVRTLQKFTPENQKSSPSAARS